MTAPINSYIDTIMTNHEFATSSDNYSDSFQDTIIRQNGGNPDNAMDRYKHIATGSFAPIYIMTVHEKELEEISKNRTFAAPNKKTALSIKEIMKERRDADDKKPFISF